MRYPQTDDSFLRVTAYRFRWKIIGFLAWTAWGWVHAVRHNRLDTVHLIPFTFIVPVTLWFVLFPSRDYCTNCRRFRSLHDPVPPPWGDNDNLCPWCEHPYFTCQ